MHPRIRGAERAGINTVAAPVGSNSDRPSSVDTRAAFSACRMRYAILSCRPSRHPERQHPSLTGLTRHKRRRLGGRRAAKHEHAAAMTGLVSVRAWRRWTVFFLCFGCLAGYRRQNRLERCFWPPTAVGSLGSRPAIGRVRIMVRPALVTGWTVPSPGGPFLRPGGDDKTSVAARASTIASP